MRPRLERAAAEMRRLQGLNPGSGRKRRIEDGVETRAERLRRQKNESQNRIRESRREIAAKRPKPIPVEYLHFERPAEISQSVWDASCEELIAAGYGSVLREKIPANWRQEPGCDTDEAFKIHVAGVDMTVSES